MDMRKRYHPKRTMHADIDAEALKSHRSFKCRKVEYERNATMAQRFNANR